MIQPLSSPGPFTLFAPTDAAFEALGTETLAKLDGDPERFTALLARHVAPGRMSNRSLWHG